MTHPRLSLALDGADALPLSGQILALGPVAAAGDLPLPKERTTVVQGFRPDHDTFAARGYRTVPAVAEAGSGFAAAIVFLPRSRGAAHALVAEAAARVVPGGPVWVDGAKTDGIDSILKEVRARVAVSAPFAKAHGKVFRFDAPGPEAFAGWAAADIHPAPGFVTRPGVFSADKIDRGSALLAEALPQGLKGRVADLGAGWGWLAAQILARPGVSELHLVEADHAALACAEVNIDDPRARFHWADATRFRPPAKLDAVVMNPPFHAGRAAEPALGQGFIEAAAAMLAPSGSLYMVANRHLPYEAVLTRHFRELAEIGGDTGFKLFRAARPGEPARPRR
ncbi:class I SAM-dependent methyltransferase [Defluviimonas sp. WL0024]|uniref:Class I SAM-dependent methyltransferase n=1 Tax=Albidovulum salinarum TaxID=2984153 RepID=A0ABT2X8E2_9RHOB|nr:class I SAM-dependent methyltransferase [Defluviimonas sp. WL0024]MCU9850216.1 class I SAM-dependent methyltransferase [Defluviimonas sp. WL0024]